MGGRERREKITGRTKWLRITYETTIIFARGPLLIKHEELNTFDRLFMNGRKVCMSTKLCINQRKTKSIANKIKL